MKENRLLLVLLAFLCLTTAAGLAVAASPPTPAALKAYSGKVVYVDFWASWCGPCAQSFPWLNTLKARFGDRLQVVGVNVDEDPAAAEAFLATHPAGFPIVRDPSGKIAALYAIQGMPSTVILNPQGQVVHQHSGFKESMVSEYENAIQAALGAPTGAKK